MDKVLKDLERFGVKSDDETYFVEEQPERNKMIKKNKISFIIFFIIYLPNKNFNGICKRFAQSLSEW